MANKKLISILALCFCAVAVAVAVAEQRCYQTDAESGELGFRGEAEGNRFSGQFAAFTVELCLDEADPATAVIEVTVDTGSASVGNRQGDEALHGKELFNIERFPQARWQSGKIEKIEDGYLAGGELTLRGVSGSQPVSLSFDLDEDRLGLSGSAEILRIDFGVGEGEFADPDFIRNRVDLHFELEMIRRP